MKKGPISHLIILHLNQLVDVWNPLYAVAEDENCKNMVRSWTNLVLDIQVDTAPRNNFIASVLQWSLRLQRRADHPEDVRDKHFSAKIVAAPDIHILRIMSIHNNTQPINM